MRYASNARRRTMLWNIWSQQELMRKCKRLREHILIIFRRPKENHLKLDHHRVRVAIKRDIQAIRQPQREALPNLQIQEAIEQCRKHKMTISSSQARSSSSRTCIPIRFKNQYNPSQLQGGRCARDAPALLRGKPVGA